MTGEGPQGKSSLLSLADRQVVSRQTWFGTFSGTCWKMGLGSAKAAAGLTPAAPSSESPAEAKASVGSVVGWKVLAQKHSCHTCSPGAPLMLRDLPRG